jgi:hypothetical protein
VVGMGNVYYVYSDLASGGVLEDDFEEENEPSMDGCGVYGDYRLAGNGKVTNENCGKWFSFFWCPRSDLHGEVHLDGKSYDDKAFVKHTFVSCHKVSCPICYRSGWANREAEKIEYRLKECEKRFGEAQHIALTFPSKYFGLSFESLKKKAKEVMDARGIFGGCMIFHAFRFHSAKEAFLKGGVTPVGWFYSPHFHVLGFIAGGYGKCRDCGRSRLDCISCGGFEGKTRLVFQKDGCIAKVMGKRKSVKNTAWYQLTHASYNVSSKRANVVSWFGVCSYRKMKLTPLKRKMLCPVCGSELVRCRYIGDKFIEKNRDNPMFQMRFFSNMYSDDGLPVWEEVCVSGSHRFS